LDGRHYGKIHDYYGGVNDLRQGFVRVLHSLSFVDDPTRILRAVRFEQRFGFRIEPRTLYLAIEARNLMERLSGDRIRHEINHILIDPKAGKILERLFELQLLQTIHPTLIWDGWLQEKFRTLPSQPPDLAWGLGDFNKDSIFKRDLSYCLLLIRLTEKEVTTICDRLKLPSKFKEQILSASTIWKEIPLLVGNTPSRITSVLDEVSPLARYAAYYASEDDKIRVIFENYTSKWQGIHPRITGRFLRSQGIPPGPVYKEILDQLRNAMLDGIISTEEEEKNYFSQIIQNIHSSSL
jgi:tRNA nucleotidyltransferase (CCA-adding enzyme)